MKKINIVDVLVILLIIAMVVVVGLRVKKYNAVNDSTSSIDKFEYEIKISNVRDYTVDAFLIGDTLFDSQTNVKIGKIIDKNVNASQKYIVLEDGSTKKENIPERYDMILTVETDGLISDNGYYAEKTIEIKVGSEKLLETLYAKSTGTIISINTVK